MRRVLLVLAVALVMAAMVLTIAPVALAAAQITRDCDPWLNSAGVQGTECGNRVDTPSGKTNGSAHFTPDERPGGGTVQQGAQHNLNNACGPDSGYSACNFTYTPSGNANGTVHINP
jgi:hypothetical protein